MKNFIISYLGLAVIGDGPFAHHWTLFIFKLLYLPVIND